MNIFHRNKTLLGTLAVFLILGGLVWVVSRVPVDPIDTVLVQPTTKEVVITGTFSCLAFRNGTLVTNENCVMGLRGDDQKTYALDSSQVTIVSKTINPEDHIRVVGVLTVPNTSVDEGNAFDIQGVVKVRAIQHAGK